MERQLWRERIARALAELKKDASSMFDRGAAHAAADARQSQRDPNDDQ
jgi:hypothetical protein